MSDKNANASDQYANEFVTWLAENHGINVVFTGGPSVGKSTVADRLSKIGFNITPETASILIQSCKRFLVARGLGEPRPDPAIIKACAEAGEVHPLVDNPAFQKKLSSMQFGLEHEAVNRIRKGLNGFDRAMPDIPPYCDFYKVSLPVEFENMNPAPAQRYDLCFVLESFNKFVDNGIRVENKDSGVDFAKIIGPKLGETYRKYGVITINVPAFIHDDPETSIKWRMDFIWQQICEYAESRTKLLRKA